MLGGGGSLSREAPITDGDAHDLRVGLTVLRVVSYDHRL
jgi:hypothetical protein